MNMRRRNIFSILDHAVRWTGIPGRVADQMSDDPSVDPKYRPLRWIPMWPIAFSCALFILCVIWPSVLNRVPLGALVGVIVPLMGGIMMMVPGINMHGPLGKPSLEDDEREAALRKDSFLFCLGLLAFLNCLGQPVLLSVSHLQNWQTVHSVSVAGSAFILNATLLGCLPTLYASWKLPQLPKE